MGKSLHELSANSIAETVFKTWFSPKGVNFASLKAETSYRERCTRIKNAIQLKMSDRVPIWFQDSGFFPCKYTGINCEDAMYNPEKWFSKTRETFIHFKPDMIFRGTSIHASGQAYEALSTRTIKWPGHGVTSEKSFQFVEGEYMIADEYDAFINDLSDYIIRTYLPRIYGSLEPLKMLPHLYSLGFGLPGISAVFANHELMSAFESLYHAALESVKWMTALESFEKEMNSLGFPVLIGSAANVPFDQISDKFRGMRGAMVDMYRQPDKLIEAMEKLIPITINQSLSLAKRSGKPGIFIALHRGADGFMSPQQFETFYWPYLKRLILALIDEGFTPCPFFEGDYTSRLEYLTEIPKGKVLGFFDRTDFYRAKEILGNTMCISGMMPVSLLQVGTPEKVRDYAKELIDVVGKGGGFIMGPRSVMDEANPELVKVWFDFTREYGVFT